MQLNAVVLPAPFGPTIETTLPRPTSKPRSLTATSPPNFLVMPLTSSSAVDEGSAALLIRVELPPLRSLHNLVFAGASRTNDHDRRLSVVAIRRVLEIDIRSQRTGELEAPEEILDLRPIGRVRTLHALDDRVDRVISKDGFGLRGNREGLIVILEPVLELTFRGLDVDADPRVSALDAPVGGFPDRFVGHR